jgi:PAS domain S-box-containing protein
VIETQLGILGEDFALLLLLGLGQSAIERWLASWSRTARQVVSGCWFGLVATVAILMAVRVAPGILMDVRGVAVMGASALIGPLAGAIAAVAACVVRYWLGGVGVLPGNGTAITVAIAGYLLARWRRADTGVLWPAAFGFIGGALQVSWVLAMPPGVAETLLRTRAPLLLASFSLGFVLLSVVVGRERERTERERRLAAILDWTPLFIGLLDPRGRILQVNRAGLEFMERDDGAARGRFFWEGARCGANSTAADRLHEAVQRAAGGVTARFEAELAGADGRCRLFEFQLYPIRDRAGRVVMLLPEGRDITEQRAAEARLRETEISLRQAQKMEAVGQLTGGIAHDFNNILAIISGNLDLMRRHSLPEEVRRVVDSARRAVTRAATLTRYLLAFSRKEQLRPAAVSTNTIVADTAAMLRRTLGDRILVRTDLADDLRLGYYDAHQLESALLNLAINARDAMPEGGTLTIATGNARSKPGFAGDAVRGDHVRITVHDTGTGMSPDVLRRAVEPFFTTKPVGSGSGLGLSMVYGFAQQSGGHIELDSTVGEGTTVTLYLPATEGFETEDIVAHLATPAV